MNVLVTGGLGQIGSHVSEMLLARGDRVVVIDNLATGQRHHLADHPQLTVVIDTIANRDKVRELCAAHKFDAIVHTADVTVPLGAAAKPSFRLGEICRANGIALSEDEAHDAMADTKATLALLRHLRDVAPTAVATLLGLADKGVPHRMMASSEVLLLGGSARLTPVVGVTANPTVATSWAVADHTVDPAAYTSEGPGAFFEMGSDAVASRAGGSKFLAFRQFPAHQTCCGLHRYSHLHQPRQNHQLSHQLFYQ